MPNQTPHVALEVAGWRIATQGTELDLLPGIAGPASIEAEGPVATAPTDRKRSRNDEVPTPDGGLRLRLGAEFDFSADCYLVRRLEVFAEYDEVTGTSLKTLAPLTLLRWVLPAALTTATDANPYCKALIRGEQPTPAQAGEAPPTLDDVAEMFWLAGALRINRLDAVARTTGMPTGTASKRIVQARASGLLLLPLDERLSAAELEDAALAEWESR